MKNRKKYSKQVKAQRLRNKKLVKKYPWLRPVNVWSGKRIKKYDYSYINWGCGTEGWELAFGDMYLKELGEAVKNQKNFMILDHKEKYGSLRIYTNGTTQEAHNIIAKYEFISQNVCYICGKPDVPMLNTGWICPECFDCFKKRMRQEGWSRYKDNSDEELEKLYYELAEKPNEDGSWTIPNIRKARYWDKEHDGEIIEYDISDTVKAIRDRYQRRLKNYEKRIHRN